MIWLLCDIGCVKAPLWELALLSCLKVVPPGFRPEHWPINSSMLAMARNGGRLWDWVLGHNWEKGGLRGGGHHTGSCSLSAPGTVTAIWSLLHRGAMQNGLTPRANLLSGRFSISEIGSESGWTNKCRSQHWIEKKNNNQTCLIQMRQFAKVCSSISNMIFAIAALKENLKSVIYTDINCRN